MHQKLSVTIQVDLDGKHIQVLVTGCLTTASQRALHPLIRRARTLTPGIHLTIDLTGAHHIETTGVEQLRQAVTHDTPAAGGGPVKFAVPDPLPDHLSVTALQHLMASRPAPGTTGPRKVPA